MLRQLLRFDGQMEVADIGAAAIAEVPPYKALSTSTSRG
jgi:hypothetical protein